MDRVGRLRHAQSAGTAGLRHRPGCPLWIRVRHGDRTHTDVPTCSHRHARHGRGRCPVHPGLRRGGVSVKLPVSWLREYVDAPLDPVELEAALVRVGLEVEDITDLRGSVSGPRLVGRVEAMTEVAGV